MQKVWETRRSSVDIQHNTCSKECEFIARSRAHKNIPKPAETRKKLSIAHKGKLLSESHKAAIGRGVAGPRNRFWIDGRSWNEDDYGGQFTKQLKKMIHLRDDLSCQECSRHRDELKLLKLKLAVHHIDENKLNNLCSNLITLCESCHSILHKNLAYVPKNPILKPIGQPWGGGAPISTRPCLRPLCSLDQGTIGQPDIGQPAGF